MNNGDMEFFTMILLFGNVFLVAIIVILLIKKRKNEAKHIEFDDFQKRVFETVPEVLFKKDKEFKIVKANKSFFDLYPFSKQGRVGLD